MKQPETTSLTVVSNFYETAPKTLDAVYIGSSTTIKFWNSMLAWESFGITVQPLATNRNPVYTAADFIREARKRQPDALFIVNLNTVSESLEAPTLRAVIDSFPFSLQKLRLIKDMCDFDDRSLDERLQYVFPIIRYHTRWNELTTEDFSAPEIEHYKGAAILRKTVDVSENYHYSEKAGELLPNQVAAIDSVLDFCDREHVKVLFVVVPQAKKGQKLESINAVQKQVEEHGGYPVLDLFHDPEAIGLDLTCDFYDASHTNIHGSAKFTYYVSDYLIKNYGFTDKRGLEEYSSWDETLQSYNEEIASCFLDIEHIPFANTAYMSAPQITVERVKKGIDVSWTESEGADGYLVYRKISSNAPYTLMLDTTDTHYSDPDEYRSFYIVVPYCGTDEREYGSFIREGVRVAE
ncbi:MAG: hypothetical protein Q4G19_07080 [Clostridia bacterium]|nr:hypothetical protein [Clostridia bacterium]